MTSTACTASRSRREYPLQFVVEVAQMHQQASLCATTSEDAAKAGVRQYRIEVLELHVLRPRRGSFSKAATVRCINGPLTRFVSG
jgi:hypothetical protein